VKVVLREAVSGLGKRGDIIDVATGYARNYLIPQSLAIPATPGIEAQADSMRRSRMLRDAKDREAAEEIAKHLVSRTIVIPVRADGDRLFGSVGAGDVSAAINEQAGVDIDRRKLQLADSIKELGSYQIVVQLHSDVQFPVMVEVVRA
jgi:large subunit ribosomal protein L9